MFFPDLLGLELEHCIHILKQKKIKYKINITASPNSNREKACVKRIIRQKYDRDILEITYSFFYK